MKPQAVLPFFSLLAAAAPSGSFDRRQLATLCEQYGYWSGNGYEVNNNLWGRDAATSGSQCSYMDGSSGSGVQWHTTWTWNGGQNNVKSYAYSGRQLARGRTVASVGSMQTSASWRSGDYELMIWLAKYGDIYPIGSSVGTVTVAGRTWNLWVGMNGRVKFFNYLQSSQGFPASSQNLIVFQLGTEAFTGSQATFRGLPLLSSSPHSPDSSTNTLLHAGYVSPPAPPWATLAVLLTLLALLLILPPTSASSAGCGRAPALSSGTKTTTGNGRTRHRHGQADPRPLRERQRLRPGPERAGAPRAIAGGTVKTVYAGCSPGHPVVFVAFDEGHVGLPPDRGGDGGPNRLTPARSLGVLLADGSWSKRPGN
ncbi:hypothetical protein VTK56DRAFT_6765 [Thermocarpiscus australiensis]